MEQLTRALAWMLRCSAGALPADRREWGEAVRAEAGQVPAGWPRWCWLAWPDAHASGVAGLDRR